MTLQVYEKHEAAVYLDNQQVQLLKDTICKGATDQEFELFVGVCRRTGLDPFAKQVYPVKRWDGKLGRETMTIQTSIDGYRLIADRTGKYCPGREPTYDYDNAGNLIAATAYVKKQTRDGTWHEVAAKAFYSEYCQTFLDKKTGEKKPTQFWEQMKHNQTAKCAEALALRKAFPGEFSGVYTKEEMQQAEVLEARVDVKQHQLEVDPIPSQVYVTPAQAVDLKEIHDRCEPAFKEKVLNQIRALGITQWAKVPASMFDALQRAAIANYEAYQVAVEAELGNINE